MNAVDVSFIYVILTSKSMNLGIVHVVLFPPTNMCYFRNRLAKAMLDSVSGPDCHLCFAKVSCFPALLTKAVSLAGREEG